MRCIDQIVRKGRVHACGPLIEWATGRSRTRPIPTGAFSSPEIADRSDARRRSRLASMSPRALLTWSPTSRAAPLSDVGLLARREVADLILKIPHTSAIYCCESQHVPLVERDGRNLFTSCKRGGVKRLNAEAVASASRISEKISVTQPQVETIAKAAYDPSLEGAGWFPGMFRIA